MRLGVVVGAAGVRTGGSIAEEEETGVSTVR